MELPKIIVGITGATASGKSYLASQINNYFKENSVLINQDNYFYPEELQPKDINGNSNYDTPNSLDLNKFKNDILKLKNGESVTQERYNYNKPLNSDKYLHYHPKQIIVVEGIFSLYLEELFSIFNLKIYVDSDFDTIIERRIRRDWIERSYDKNDVLYKFQHHIVDSYKEYILPLKEKCEIVVFNGKENPDFNEKSGLIIKKVEGLLLNK